MELIHIWNREPSDVSAWLLFRMYNVDFRSVASDQTAPKLIDVLQVQAQPPPAPGGNGCT